MKNIPRIYLESDIKIGKILFLPEDKYYYLKRVMRTDNCLVFNNGYEFSAKIISKNEILIEAQTDNFELLRNIILYFSPIKKIADLINMTTQIGVNVFQPVIMDYTNINNLNLDRLKKITIEASEQSNRCYIPKIFKPIHFNDFNKTDVIFGDERGINTNKKIIKKDKFLIGPEGGFSKNEFICLEQEKAIGVSLGKNILRSETASVALLSKILL